LDPSTVLNALGQDWLLDFEKDGLSAAAHSTMLQERIRVAQLGDDFTSKLNQRGTVLISHPVQCEARAEAAKARLAAEVVRVEACAAEKARTVEKAARQHDNALVVLQSYQRHTEPSKKQAFVDKLKVLEMEAVMVRYAPTVIIKAMLKPALKDELTQRIDGFPLVPQPEPVTPNPVTTSTTTSSSMFPALSTTGKKQPAKRKSTLNGDEGNVSLPPMPRLSHSGRTINTPTKFTS